VRFVARHKFTIAYGLLVAAALAILQAHGA